MISKFLIAVLGSLSISSFADSIVPVSSVDLSKYAGRWYEISANPSEFEIGCFCGQQTLTEFSDGRIGVYTSCNLGQIDGPLSEIRGLGTNDNRQSNSEFTIDFSNQHVAKYWIIALAPDYRWSVVSEPNGQALYILAKSPVLSVADYRAAVREAAKQVDTRGLVLMTQQNCSYPEVFD